MLPVLILVTGANVVSPNFIQEQLSLAYVRAVVFRSGLSLSRPDVDDHGIDGTIVDPHRRGVNRVDFQLKSTTSYGTTASTVGYDLRVQNYNQLIVEDDVPGILILFIMPDDDDQWLLQDEEELCLRKCAYWVSLMGMARSSNSSTQRVSVPLVNIFDQNGLRNIFDQLI